MTVPSMYCLIFDSLADALTTANIAASMANAITVFFTDPPRGFSPEWASAPLGAGFPRTREAGNLASAQKQWFDLVVNYRREIDGGGRLYRDSVNSSAWIGTSSGGACGAANGRSMAPESDTGFART